LILHTCAGDEQRAMPHPAIPHSPNLTRAGITLDSCRNSGPQGPVQYALSSSISELAHSGQGGPSRVSFRVGPFIAELSLGGYVKRHSSQTQSAGSAQVRSPRPSVATTREPPASSLGHYPGPCVSRTASPALTPSIVIIFLAMQDEPSPRIARPRW
jgi:hypothetical protein